MSIYSANRSAAAGTVVESKYNDICIDQIMYESEVNSMKIFEAAIGSDFMEIQGLREGTLLKEEADEKEKKTVKDFIEQIKKSMKLFWEKLKAFFNAALEKLKTAYINFVKPSIARFNKIPDDKFDVNKTFHMPVVYNTSASQLATDNEKGIDDDIVHIIASEFANANFSKTEVVGRILGNYLHTDSVTPDEFKAKMKEKSFIETDDNPSHRGNIKLTKDQIKRELVDAIDMKKIITGYKTAEKEMSKKIDSIASGAADVVNSNIPNISKLNEIYSAYQTAISMISKAQIQNAYAAVVMYNKYLNQVVNMLMPSAKNEAFVLEADSVVDDAECDTPDVADSSAEFDKMVADTMVEVEDIVSDDNKED